MADKINNILQLNFSDIPEINNQSISNIDIVNGDEDQLSKRIALSMELSNMIYHNISEYVMNKHCDMTVAEVLFGVAFTICSSLDIMYPQSQDMTDKEGEIITKEIMDVIKNNDLYAEDALKVLSSALINYLAFLVHKDSEDREK